MQTVGPATPSYQDLMKMMMISRWAAMQTSAQMMRRSLSAMAGAQLSLATAGSQQRLSVWSRPSQALQLWQKAWPGNDCCALGHL